MTCGGLLREQCWKKIGDELVRVYKNHIFKQQVIAASREAVQTFRKVQRRKFLRAMQDFCKKCLSKSPEEAATSNESLDTLRQVLNESIHSAYGPEYELKVSILIKINIPILMILQVTLRQIGEQLVQQRRPSKLDSSSSNSSSEEQVQTSYSSFLNDFRTVRSLEGQKALLDGMYIFPSNSINS